MMRHEPIGWTGFISGVFVVAAFWVAALIGMGLFARASVWLFCLGYGCN